MTIPAKRKDAIRTSGLYYLYREWKLSRGFNCFNSASKCFASSRLCEPELFTAMVVHDVLGDYLSMDMRIDLLRFLYDHLSEAGTFSFFRKEGKIPPDIDCTALGLVALARSGLSGCRIGPGLNRIIANTNREGVIEVYIDAEESRQGIVDPVVCVNALYALNFFGRDHEALATKEFVYEILRTNAYCEGTRYYPSADTFLYRLAVLVKNSEGKYAHFVPRLKKAINERIGATACPVERAQRIMAASEMGIANNEDLRPLLELREYDGSWSPGAFFQYGRSKLFFGSKVLSTALSLGAIMRY